jgi:anthranilate phosphoribosyltransferase
VFERRDAGAHRDALLLNAALVLEVTGRASTTVAGIEATAAAIDRGDAARLLGRLAEFGLTVARA